VTRIQRLICAECGQMQRVKNQAGWSSPCFDCGPTTWFTLSTRAPERTLTVDPIWDASTGTWPSWEVEMDAFEAYLEALWQD
jgi:hypothetical protein